MNIVKRTFNPLLSRRSFRYEQTENAKLKYIGNWGPAIQPGTISSSEWTVEDGNATLSNESSGTGTTSVFITSAVTGENVITNKVTLSTGEVDERIIKLKVIDNEEPELYDDYWTGRLD